VAAVLGVFVVNVSASSSAVSGTWGPWSWDFRCSVRCGQGTMQRTRVCHGNNCVGASFDHMICIGEPCPWGPWSYDVPCSVSCGQGTRQRTRVCQGNNCIGASFENIICIRGQPCPDTTTTTGSAATTPGQRCRPKQPPTKQSGSKDVHACSDHMMLTITPASIIVGHTKDLTFMCKVLDPASYSLVTYLRLSKVHPGGSSTTTLVELLPKVQQDDEINVYNEYKNRSHVTGNLDQGQGDLYLKVIIPRPVKEDAGEYSCFMNFKRTNSELGQSSITGSF